MHLLTITCLHNKVAVVTKTFANQSLSLKYLNVVVCITVKCLVSIYRSANILPLQCFATYGMHAKQKQLVAVKMNIVKQSQINNLVELHLI